MSDCQYSNSECVNIQYNTEERCENVTYRERIKNIREDRDMTQAEIGRLLHKSQQGYNHIETGRAELKIDDLIKLCKFYGLSADYIIGLINTPKSYK